jgi:hypothetical protein
MTAWENKTKAIKTGWTETKGYFERLVCNFEIYNQNSGGTTGKSKYKSANQATKAAKGNKLRHYISTIAAAVVAKDKKQDKIAANICNSVQKIPNEMATQLKSSATLLPQSQKHLPTKRTMVAATLVAAVLVAAVMAAAVERNHGKSCNAWAATVGPTATICVATTTPVQYVHSRRKATRAMPLLTTPWEATTTGHLCIASLTLKQCTQHLWESPSPPPEMDWGMTKQKKKRRIVKQ